MAIENQGPRRDDKGKSCPFKTFPLFIGTGFPPFYRVIDPIARGRYALSIMLLGQIQSAFTANLSSIKFK